ncbi:membrane protein [hydrothermal vent metagenome]|uniref:Membrane protein n=1 Tax=hydrothermal vent metagenome TaxID=652676 RepID=A0A1W1BLC8_9ZZZZ
MQLDDLIKQETLRDIMKRTHISKNLLDILSNKEFDKVNRTQAIGTISILEREYDADLSEVRDEINLYFSQNSRDNNRFVVTEPVVQENNFLSKFFVLLLIAMIAYGSWYFFSAYYRPASQDMETKSEKSLLDIIIAGKDTIMDKVNGKSSQETTVVVETTEREVSDSTPTPTKKVETKIVDNQEGEGIKESKESEEVASDQKSRSSDTNTSKTVEEQSVTPSSENSKTTEDALVTKREKITILPQKMMLFQLINLKTKRELRFKRKEQYDIDLKDNGWLFKTENSVFAFIDNDIFEEYGGKGKIFFKLDQDGIHQLSEDEYKKALRG